jgi:multidrug efflux pump subunit AcrA (membrane-fusion protein)
MSELNVGQKIYFKVDAYPDRKFYSKITKISPVVDKVSKTFFVESIYENTDNLLKSGMTAEIHIILKERNNVVAVPVGAVVYRNKIPYVYIVNRTNNIAVEKKLNRGLITADWIEAKNLKEGNEIITVGLYGIKNGVKLKIVSTD